MTSTPSQQEHPDRARPTGLVRPENDRALRALAAVESGRLKDAAAHVDSIPEEDSLDRAWKLLLRGLVELERPDYSAAFDWLEQATDAAFADGESGPSDSQRDSMRLAAYALQNLGRLHRRQDRSDDACRLHTRAHELRTDFGSHEEAWETAMELGLDADMTRSHQIARKWYHVAVKQAHDAAEEPEKKQAIAWAGLAGSFGEAKQHDQAVEAARTARGCWRRHDIGSVDTALADLKLGFALLRNGESLHGSDTQGATIALNEAIEWLTIAVEALKAFGQDYAADVRWGLEQKDFAERLRASVDL